MGYFLQRSQRALCGPSFPCVGRSLFVVPFVEKARSEVYTFHENFERGWPVGGVITNHTFWVSHPDCHFGAGVFLASLPSKVEELVTRGVEVEN